MSEVNISPEVILFEHLIKQYMNLGFETMTYVKNCFIVYVGVFGNIR